MIITQTPLRISFLGGGTDYPEHFLHHGGSTLVTTIDKYCLVSVHPLTAFSDHQLRVHYSRVETVGTLEEIQHPSARECLRFMEIDGGIEIHYLNDLPARTGLGSSSATTVGLLRALHAHRRRMVGKDQLAAEAVHVERNLIQERVGYQDQYATTFGGFLCLEFRTDGAVHVEPVPIGESRLGELRRNLLLLYTGIQRTAHEVLEEQLERTRSSELVSELSEMNGLVDRGMKILASERPLSEFAGILHENWLIKRRLSSKISGGQIDAYYDRARQEGALGGKLLGAGGGGFLLLFVPPEKQSKVLEALPELRTVDFDFDRTGSTTIFYRP